MSKIFGGTTATPMKMPDLSAINSLKYYGDANIVPSDADLFEFTHSPVGGGVAIEHIAYKLPKDVVIPYEAKVDGETLPITFLWDMCFASNDDVENLVIPNTVVEIGINACEGCSSLKSITISVGVNTIGSDAFNGCPIEDIYYTGTKAQWDAISILEGNEALSNARIHFKWAEDIGDIDEALDNIIAIQNSLIGGDA